MPLFRAFALFLEGFATIDSGTPGGELEGMRRGVELLRERNALVFDGLMKIALAEAESRAGDPARALVIVDEALATCERTGYAAFEGELRRVRGQALSNRDALNVDAAEREFPGAPSLSQDGRARAASACAGRCRSPSSSSPRTDPPTPAPSLRPLLKAFR